MTCFVTPRFRTAVDRLLFLEDQQGEGKVTNSKTDRGGLTKWGISQRAYPKLDIRNLTRNDAIEIYHKDYWCPLRCNDFLSQALAEELFEFGVNAGVGTAAKALQTAINGRGRPVSVDGCIGSATLAAAVRIGQPELLAAFRTEAARHYRAIVQEHPGQSANLAGWMNRLKGADA